MNEYMIKLIWIFMVIYCAAPLALGWVSGWLLRRVRRLGRNGGRLMQAAVVLGGLGVLALFLLRSWGRLGYPGILLASAPLLWPALALAGCHLALNRRVGHAEQTSST